MCVGCGRRWLLVLFELFLSMILVLVLVLYRFFDGVVLMDAVCLCNNDDDKKEGLVFVERRRSLMTSSSLL